PIQRQLCFGVDRGWRNGRRRVVWRGGERGGKEKPRQRLSAPSPISAKSPNWRGNEDYNGVAAGGKPTSGKKLPTETGPWPAPVRPPFASNSRMARKNASAEPTVTFWGAARTVTGSMHQLSVRGQSVLLDCGLFQGRRAESYERNRKFPFRPKDVNAVVL